MESQLEQASAAEGPKLVSITRFRLRSGALRGQVLFFWHTIRSIRQAARPPGFLRGKVMQDVGRAFWTITIWEDMGAMRAYRNSGHHRDAMKAMPRFMRYCDEAATAHWEYAGPDFPAWAEVHERLVAAGHFLRLGDPSPAHQSRQISAPRPGSGEVAIQPRGQRRFLDLRPILGAD